MPDHPPETLLSTYALDPSLVEDAAGLDAHLAGCAPCRERLAAIRDFDQFLADPESWSEAGVSLLLPALRAQSAVSARNRREDAAADALLTPVVERFLTVSSGKFMWADIASRAEYHTGGVVRKLADAADKAQYSAPLRALILAETASDIVEMLSRTTYTATEIAALRGVSWKQQANANRQLGRFKDALEALQHAEKAFRELPRAELDLASVTFIRATLYFEQQDYDAANQHAEQSTTAFTQLGQDELYFRSWYLQGCIAFERRQLGEAQMIFDSILAYGERTGDASWIARASFELGNCHLERLGLPSASQHFHRSMAIFRNLGMQIEVIRCRWGLALVEQRGHRYRTAISRLREIVDDFADHGVVTDAALATLDVMETFLSLGKPREVQQAAGNIVRLFKDAGMVTSALTAADYLKQAALMQRVTPSIIDYVRRYFRRADRQPDLVFVPPTAL